MKALTIKELAPYLPYDVDCVNTSMGIELHKPMNVYVMLNMIANDTNYRLQLRPLSSLTKEITHGGETFVPLERIAKESCPFQIKADASYETVQEDQMCYCNIIVRGIVIWCLVYHYHTGNFYTGVEEDKVRFYQLECHQMLFKYHLDVFNLLSNNLAEPIKD